MKTHLNNIFQKLGHPRSGRADAARGPHRHRRRERTPPLSARASRLGLRCPARAARRSPPSSVVGCAPSRRPGAASSVYASLSHIQRCGCGTPFFDGTVIARAAALPSDGASDHCDEPGGEQCGTSRPGSRSRGPSGLGALAARSRSCTTLLARRSAWAEEAAARRRDRHRRHRLGAHRVGARPDDDAARASRSSTAAWCARRTSSTSSCSASSPPASSACSGSWSATAWPSAPATPSSATSRRSASRASRSTR